MIFELSAENTHWNSVHYNFEKLNKKKLWITEIKLKWTREGDLDYVSKYAGRLVRIQMQLTNSVILQFTLFL